MTVSSFCARFLAALAAMLDARGPRRAARRAERAAVRAGVRAWGLPAWRRASAAARAAGVHLAPLEFLTAMRAHRPRRGPARPRGPQ